MTATYKTLGQSAPGAASLTTLYTAPSAAIVSTFTAANRSATPTAIRVAISPLGAAIADGHYIAFDLPIGANEVIPLPVPINLATTDLIRVYNTLATVSFNANGVELTV